MFKYKYGLLRKICENDQVDKVILPYKKLWHIGDVLISRRQNVGHKSSG